MYEIDTVNSAGVFPSHDHTPVHVVSAAKAVLSTVQNPTLLLTQTEVPIGWVCPQMKIYSYFLLPELDPGSPHNSFYLTQVSWCLHHTGRPIMDTSSCSLWT